MRKKVTGVTFFTVCDKNFLPGAFALMRSVKLYFPESERYIKLQHSSSETSRFRQDGMSLAQILPADHSGVEPADPYYSLAFSRFEIDDVPGKYLVYLDADCVATGRVRELLSVPPQLLGLVSERNDDYKFEDQFVKTAALGAIENRYGVSRLAPSINTGVIAGSRGAWLRLSGLLNNAFSADPDLFRKSKGNQGVIQAILPTAGFWEELPRPCNEIKTHTWDQHTPTVLHFTKGNTRPWRTGSSRRDNSYPAFREWRRYSKVSDFFYNGTFWQELFWRSLDDVRPFIRKFR